MMKHLKRFVAITISMVMAFQFCTNDFYLYAETEPADPGQTQVTNEPESEPSDSTGEAAEETPSSDIGTPEPSAPVEEQPAAPVEEWPVTPVEEQLEVASTLKVEFVDANNASVKETVEQALTSKYVGKTINLDELGIDINVEGYTLTEVKDKNDNTQAYTTETKDFVLTGNVTELQFVYTQNVQTDQAQESQEPSTPQGGQEDQNSEEDQEDTDDEDSDSQADKEDESVEETKEEELAYPAQFLSAKASDGAQIYVNATSEGILPEGCSLSVDVIKSDELISSIGLEDVSNIKAYDITILDKDGKEVQPKKSVSVTICDSGVVGHNVEVYHISNTSKLITKTSSSTAFGNQVTFLAESFSPWLLVPYSLDDEITDLNNENAIITEFQVVADRTAVTVGDTVNVRAIIKPDDYPNKSVTWKSDNENVATVNADGVVTTKQTGIVNITGTSVADPDSTAYVTILVEDVKAEKVDISGYENDYLIVGENSW